MFFLFPGLGIRKTIVRIVCFLLNCIYLVNPYLSLVYRWGVTRASLVSHHIQSRTSWLWPSLPEQKWEPAAIVKKGVRTLLAANQARGLSYLRFSSWCRIPSQGFIPTSKSQGNAPLFLSPQMSQKMRRRIILVIRSFLAHKPIFPLHAQSCVALSQRTPISLLNFQKPWSKSFSSSYNAKLSDSHSTLHSCTKNIY